MLLEIGDHANFANLHVHNGKTFISSFWRMQSTTGGSEAAR